MATKKIKRGKGLQRLDRKSFRVADEVRYIQRRAALMDARLITVGPLILFSTETGDAWLLDPSDHLAARVARDGQPEPIYIEENDMKFAIGWKGTYQIDGGFFVYADKDLGRIVSIFGYPTRQIQKASEAQPRAAVPHD